MREALISSQVYIFKSTLAGVLAIILARILVPEDLLSASFVAVLCIKPTFFTGLVLGKQQLFASVLGGVFSGLLIYIFGPGILVTALSLVVVITFCIYRKWSSYLPIAVFTVLYMIILPQDNTLETIGVRMSSVFLGVAVAAVINLLFSFIRYKSFLYYRIKYAVNLVYGKMLKTMAANISADERMLENIYSDFENIYNQLSTFASEIMDISRELKFRKKIGAITEEEINSMYRTIENLKMVVRYVQDIAYISRILVPVHTNIPVSWKKDIDRLWQQNQETFEALRNKIINHEISERHAFEPVDFTLINEINECIKNSASSEKKFLYSKIMAIVADFQQLHLSLVSLDYFSNKYIDIYREKAIK